MQTIETKQQQSLMDVALKTYGSIYGVFWLVEDNPNALIGITDTLLPGDLLKIRNQKINPQMIQYLQKYNIATAKGAQGEGIGYWRIEETFIIS